MLDRVPPAQRRSLPSAVAYPGRSPWRLPSPSVLAGGIPRSPSTTTSSRCCRRLIRTRALTELYDGESNFGSSNAVFVGVEAADVYSLDTLRYVKKLQDELGSLDRSLPVRQMARLLRLSPEESVQGHGRPAVAWGSTTSITGETLVALPGSSEALRKVRLGRGPLRTRSRGTRPESRAERLFGAYESPAGAVSKAS